jgi:hypothetical protein
MNCKKCRIRWKIANFKLIEALAHLRMDILTEIFLQIKQTPKFCSFLFNKI